MATCNFTEVMVIFNRPKIIIINEGQPLGNLCHLVPVINVESTCELRGRALSGLLSYFFLLSFFYITKGCAKMTVVSKLSQSRLISVATFCSTEPRVTVYLKPKLNLKGMESLASHRVRGSPWEFCDSLSLFWWGSEQEEIHSSLSCSWQKKK